MDKLYQKTKVIKSLYEYFLPYLNLLSTPSGRKLFLLLLAIICMQFITSIRYLYKWFLSDINSISLNAYYYLFTYTQLPLDKFAEITTKLALSLIPPECKDIPIFLIIDDTLQEKFGTNFECCKKLFDHTERNNSNFLNGHCFVALSIKIPVISGSEIRYMNIPVRFRLKSESQNKLIIASEMISDVMNVLKNSPMVILLCDSWYPKGEVIKTVKKYPNLELIASIRIDSAIFDLPPGRTGKPGRPAEKGNQLSVYNDFSFIQIEQFFIATRQGLSNLFGNIPVYWMLTTPNTNNHKAYRLFISTAMPDTLTKIFSNHEVVLQDKMLALLPWTLPLYLYSYRWSIEIMFYELKTFWSFGLYMLRSKIGIENYINVISLCYSCMQILPFVNSSFNTLCDESPQTKKYILAESIRRELFLCRFISKHETGINSVDYFIDYDGFYPFNIAI